jgi:pimeloyl-ACP methyl ester carboxylesterase
MNKPNLLIDLLLRPRNRRRNARALELTATRSIADSGFVRIGGIDQWVTIRGEDTCSPALFFLHGGPGATCSVFSPLLRSWEQHFTLIQWDQRGAGKTLRKNGKQGSGPLSFAGLADDAIELAEYVHQRLPHVPLLLVGSSLGSAIGVQVIKRRPELFAAYVGTDQNVGADPEQLGQRLALESLRAAGNHKSVRALEGIGGDPTRWTLATFQQRNRLLVQSIRSVPNMITDIILPAMLASPEHDFRDLIDIFKGMSFSLERLYDEMVAFDVRTLGQRFELPFFVFQGDTDPITPAALARRYVAELDAPYKELALIEDAGHLAAFARPQVFLKLLLDRVIPVIATEEARRGSHVPAEPATVESSS